MDLRLLIVLLVRQDPSAKKRSNPPDVTVFVCYGYVLYADHFLSSGRAISCSSAPSRNRLS